MNIGTYNATTIRLTQLAEAQVAAAAVNPQKLLVVNQAMQRAITR